MNKYEKALINIAERLEDNYSPCGSFVYSDDYQCISELVERATPKKVIDKRTNNINKDSNYDYKECDNCYRVLPICSLGRTKFCPYCGQALEFGDDKE